MSKKGLDRRRFLKTVGRFGVYPILPIHDLAQNQIIATYALYQKGNELKYFESVKDELMEMAGEIKSINNKILTEVNSRSEFAKNCLSINDRLIALYTKPGSLADFKNFVYGYYISFSLKNFDVDIVPTSLFLQRQIDSAIESATGPTDIKQFQIIPLVGSANIEYEDWPFKNLLKITVQVNLKSIGGVEQTKKLTICSIPRLKNNKIDLSLFSQPVFAELDNTFNDPIGALPVTDRPAVRKELAEQAKTLIGRFSTTLPNTTYQEIAFQINLKTAIVVNGIRVISNSNPHPISNVLTTNPFFDPELRRHNFNLNFSKAYSEKILSEIISKNFRLDVPEDFHYSITVTRIEASTPRYAIFHIFIYGEFSYNWIVSDAEVVVRLQTRYGITTNQTTGQISFIGHQRGYEGSIEASGFPPFGWGPKSPDDAVAETKAQIISSMKNNEIVRFQIPIDQTYIMFNGNALSILTDRQ